MATDKDGKKIGGKEPIGEKPLIRQIVAVSDVHRKALFEAGRGNFSKGCRVIIDQYLGVPHEG